MLVFDDEMILFSGRLGDLGWHRHAAPAIVCGLERPITILTGPNSKQASRTEATAAYIPPGLSHAPDFGGGLAVVLYLALGGAWAVRAKAAFAPADVTPLAPEPWRGLARVAQDAEVGALREHLAQALPQPLAAATPRPVAQLSVLVPALQRAAAGGGGVHLSRSRLRHLFVEQTQVPFRRYLVWNRLQTAVALACSGRSLTQAAHEAGFADSAHFSRAFRDMFGLAPSSVLAAVSGFQDLRCQPALPDL